MYVCYVYFNNDQSINQSINRFCLQMSFLSDRLDINDDREIDRDRPTVGRLLVARSGPDVTAVSVGLMLNVS